MYLKKNSIKIKKPNIFNKIIKIYFFGTISLGIVILTIIFNSGFWQENKATIINKIYYNGINNYLKIGEIFVKSLPARFNSKIRKYL